MTMKKKLCSVPGCERPHHARGWCRTHYERWQRHGDVLASVPIYVRFWTPIRPAHEAPNVCVACGRRYHEPLVHLTRTVAPGTCSAACSRSVREGVAREWDATKRAEWQVA